MSNTKKKTAKREADSPNNSIHRLHRITGQIEAIEKMMGGEQDCIAVITQIMAARSALGSLAASILTEESCKVSNYPDKQQLQKLLKQLLNNK